MKINYIVSANSQKITNNEAKKIKLQKTNGLETQKLNNTLTCLAANNIYFTGSGLTADLRKELESSLIGKLKEQYYNRNSYYPRALQRGLTQEDIDKLIADLSSSTPYSLGSSVLKSIFDVTSIDQSKAMTLMFPNSPEEKSKLLDEIKSKITVENFTQAYKENLGLEIDETYDYIDKNISPLDKTVHAYRGIHNNLQDDNYIQRLLNAQENDIVIPDYSIMYATADSKYALTYANKNKDSLLIHFVIPKGAKTTFLPAPNREFIFPPAAKFKILKKPNLKDQFKVLELEYLIEQGKRIL